MAPPRLRFTIAHLVCLGFALSQASAQTVGGTLIDKASAQPVPRAKVLLLDFDRRGRKVTLTDAKGQFTLDAAGPGTYQLSFKLDSLDLGSSPVLTLAAKDVVQREFVVQIPRGPYFDFQVSRRVAPVDGNQPPRYPDELKRQNIFRGDVLAQFIVDTLGHVEMMTFKVLRETHPELSTAVRQALPAMRFVPAMIGGRAVRQVVQWPFHFSVSR